MNTRRKFLCSMLAGVVAFGVVAGSVLADELLGILTKVDVAGKKVTVVEEGTDKEVLVTITDSTEYVTKKGNSKVDLEKIEKNIAKAKDAGKKGIQVKVEHEKGVASKISPVFKKKDAAQR